MFGYSCVHHVSHFKHQLHKMVNIVIDVCIHQLETKFYFHLKRLVNVTQVANKVNKDHTNIRKLYNYILLCGRY